MAKNERRGGLGRGLSSLMGEAYESPRPVSRSVERELVTATEAELEGTAPVTAPRRTFVEDENEEIVEVTPTESKTVNTPMPQRVTSSESQASVENPVESEKAIKSTDEVPVDEISPNPDQPRTQFKKEEIEELASSIEKDGLLQPILVRKVPRGGYQIIAGERRWQASKVAGLKTVPIRIKEADDNEALELALIENIQRSDLNPIEEAYGYRRLMERRSMTQAEVAQVVSKGRSTIANALRLLDLPEEAQQCLYEDKITAGHARAILSVPTEEGKKKLTKKIVDDKLTVREAEQLARLFSGKKEASSTKREPMPKLYKSVAKTLRDTLHTNVRVKTTKGKNKIEIEFKDEEDLQRLFNEIVAGNE